MKILIYQNWVQHPDDYLQYEFTSEENLDVITIFFLVGVVLFLIGKVLEKKRYNSSGELMNLSSGCLILCGGVSLGLLLLTTILGLVFANPIAIGKLLGSTILIFFGVYLLNRVSKLPSDELVLGIKISIIVLLLVSILNIPYEFYWVLRFYIYSASILLIYAEIKKRKNGYWRYFYLIIGIIFSPIFEIHFLKEIWQSIDLIISSLIVLEIFKADFNT